MEKENEHLQAITEIRSMMERSSRFISLSGLSGVSAGIFALVGIAMLYHYLHLGIFSPWEYADTSNMSTEQFHDFFIFLLADSSCIIILSVLVGIFFTVRKAKAAGNKIWDATTRRLLINLFIPLAAGGIFCFVLITQHIVGPVPQAVLIFYGLACLNSSKYTLNDIRYLGLTEIVLGLVALFFWEYSLFIWAIGFGVVHIVYGIVMYYKYERVG